jgi:metallo-beta-lactamase class B
MRDKLAHVSPYFMICASLVCRLHAQETRTPSTEGDSAVVQRHIDTAKKIAGKEWSFEAQFFCATDQEIAAMRILPSATENDPEEIHRAEPMRIFDNLYFVGTKEVSTWLITTPGGYFMIDSGYAGKEQSTMLAGMAKLGLDPARIKDVLITHGHSDHYGGARYLQEHYGARIYMSAEDWNFIEPKQPAAKTAPANSGQRPKRDMIARDGEPIVLGGEKVIPVLIPGHTPGSLAFIFPVTDDGETHVVGLFGGTILNPAAALPVNVFEEYLQSLHHFMAASKEMNVDVELENHPIMDDTFERMSRLSDRKPGEANPFVVGRAGFERFVDVMIECTEAQISRRNNRSEGGPQ